MGFLQRRLVQPTRDKVNAFREDVNGKIDFQKKYWSEVRESRGKRFLVTGKNTVIKAALIPYKQQMGYWTQLVGRCQQAKSVHGCIGNAIHRVFFVERENREVRHLRQFLNPMRLTISPFAIWPELFRTKYKFSAPSEFVLALPGMIAVSMAMDDIQVHGLPFGLLKDRVSNMDEEAEEVPGVNYIMELYHMGLLETGTAAGMAGYVASVKTRKTRNSLVSGLSGWIEHQGDAKYLDRVREFKDLGILSSDADLAELSRLAFQTYKGVKDKFQKGFPDRLEEAWVKALDSHPKFSKLSVEDKLLLQMFFQPPVEIAGYRDIELLARSFGKKVPSVKDASDPLHSLKDLAKSMTAAETLKVAVNTLEHPKVIVEKQTRWSKIFPKDDLPFLHRADLPAFEMLGDVKFDGQGTGINLQVLNDELSYWELAFKDPRFLDVAMAYRKGDIDDNQAMDVVFRRVADYNELYAQSRSKVKPDLAKLCAWSAGPKEQQNNSLISKPVAYGLEEMSKVRKLNDKQVEGCRIEAAEYFYNSYIKEMKAIQGTEKKVDAQEYVDGINHVLSHCPLQSPPRSCPK